MNPDQAMLKDALAPVRLPESFANFGWLDAVSLIALGLLLGLLIARLMRPFFARKLSAKARLDAKLDALQSEPQETRWLALCELAKSEGVPLTEAESRALYDPKSTHDFASLEARLRAASARKQHSKPARKPSPKPRSQAKGAP